MIEDYWPLEMYETTNEIIAICLDIHCIRNSNHKLFLADFIHMWTGLYHRFGANISIFCATKENQVIVGIFRRYCYCITWMAIDWHDY